MASQKFSNEPPSYDQVIADSYHSNYGKESMFHTKTAIHLPQLRKHYSSFFLFFCSNGQRERRSTAFRSTHSSCFCGFGSPVGFLPETGVRSAATHRDHPYVRDADGRIGSVLRRHGRGKQGPGTDRTAGNHTNRTAPAGGNHQPPDHCRERVPGVPHRHAGGRLFLSGNILCHLLLPTGHTGLSGAAQSALHELWRTVLRQGG